MHALTNANTHTYTNACHCKGEEKVLFPKMAVVVTDWLAFLLLLNSESYNMFICPLCVKKTDLEKKERRNVKH